MTELSIIIVAFGREDLVQACVASIPKKTVWETIVVDNTRNNRGFARASNIGANKAKGKYLLFLNPDTRVYPSAIETMLKEIKTHEDVGIVGPQLVEDNGTAYLSFTQQPSAKIAAIAFSFWDRLFPLNRWSRAYWYRGKSLNRRRQVEAISGAAMMMRRTDFEAVGGFDERFFLFWEDMDLSRKMGHLGKKIVYLPGAKIYHQKGGVTDERRPEIKRWFRQARFRFFKKHEGLVPAALLELWLLLQEEWRLVGVVVVATWLRFERMPGLSPLLFDQARDYLAAQEGLVNGRPPLLGIPSSLPRFRQGPVYIWALMAVFGVFQRDAEAAALMAAFIGLAAVLGVYWAAERWWGRTAALVAAWLLATSPLAVAHSRMAFIINAIPLVSLVYLWVLNRPLKSGKNAVVVGLMAGFLLQFELALFPAVGLMGVYLFKERRAIRHWGRTIGLTLVGFLVGQLPQVMYDLTHQFSQLGLFLLWVGYRILKGFHLIPTTSGSFGSPLTVFNRVAEYGVKMAGWEQPLFALIWLGLAIMAIGMYVWGQTRSWRVTWLLWWLGSMLVAFLIHGGPSEAYFPGVIVPLVLLIGWGIGHLKATRQRIAVLGIVAMGLVNSGYLIANDQLLVTERTRARDGAQYGTPLSSQQQVAEYIATEAAGRPVTLYSQDPGSEFEAYLSNWRFLIHSAGVVVAADGWPVWVGIAPEYLPTLPYSSKEHNIGGIWVATPYE